LHVADVDATLLVELALLEPDDLLPRDRLPELDDRLGRCRAPGIRADRPDLPVLDVGAREEVPVPLVEPRMRRDLAAGVVDVLVETLVIERDERIRVAPDVALDALRVVDHELPGRRVPVAGRARITSVGQVLVAVLAHADRRHG